MLRIHDLEIGPYCFNIIDIVPAYSRRKAAGQLMIVLGSLGVPPLVACSPEAANNPVWRESANEVIYDSDSRLEYYDAEATAQELTRGSVVALADRSVLKDILTTKGHDWSRVPTVTETYGLCSGERFAGQPSLAFCTGVLVDRDVILTAGHCARVVAATDIEILFDYYYEDVETLAVTPRSSASATEILSEGLDADNDFAWLRISPPAVDRRAAKIEVRAAKREQVLLQVGASYGAPLKIDPMGTVVEVPDSEKSFFIADTDTAHGASGGGAFTQNGTLLGLLASGAQDFAISDAGCLTAAKLERERAEERYTYAKRALSELCAEGAYRGPLCPANPDVEQTASTKLAEAPSCSVARSSSFDVHLGVLTLVTLVLAWGRRLAPARLS